MGAHRVTSLLNLGAGLAMRPTQGTLVIRSPRQALLPILCAALLAGATVALNAEPAFAAVPVGGMAVSSTDSTSVFGQSVTLNATITGGSGTPTGTADVLDGGVPVCSGIPIAQILPGTAGASCTTAGLAVGTHLISATYSGNGTYSPASSTTFAPATSQVVAPADTTTIVSSDDPAPSLNAPITYHATIAAVSPATGVPGSGTVSFNVNGSPISGCDVQPVTGGAAQCATRANPAGSPMITAVYTGNGDFNGSTSPGLSQSVATGTSTTAVASNHLTTAYGEDVTFTASLGAVAPASTTPDGGTVSFNLAGTPITGCGTRSVSAGIATCTTTVVPAGMQSITAVYSGDSSYGGSTSPPITQTVTKASTSTSLESDNNPSVFSTSVTFTAVVSTVAPGAGTATGSVAFRIAGNDIAGCATKALDGSAIATCTTSTLPVGTHAVTAVYAATADFAASTSAPVTQVVPQPASTTMVSSSDASPEWNDLVIYTATIAPVSPATSTPAGGVVIFLADGIAIPTCTSRPVVNGVATCATSAGPVGSLSVTAAFSGDSSYTASTSPAITQTVSKAATATALASDHNPSRSGQAVTLSATVTSTAGVPGGTVSFFQVQKDSSRKLLAVGTLAAGHASITTDAMPVRSGHVVATYNSEPTFAASTTTMGQTVSRSFSNTLLTSSQKNATAGTVVIFRVVVASQGDGAGTPTGLISLYRVRANGSRAWIGRGNLRTDGSTLITVGNLPNGAWKIVAEYRGSTQHRASHRSMTQTLRP